MPNVIIHFAEQRAAPYSMKDFRTKNYTIDNNINATHNILNAIVSTNVDTHLIHLGTMGVYGYGTAGIEIPEGYLNVKIKKENDFIDQEILYPTNPGSIYHLTKSIDQLLFFYYKKNNDLKITDLHQGIVWGTQTKETTFDEILINRFDYDGDYGTVLNRFLMQSALKYPLTVHGSGGQTRAFIHIEDSIKCINLAIKNPPSEDRVKIYNQVTETHRVRDLAKLISSITGDEITYLDNPRNEASENDLNVSNKSFLSLGLEPKKLSENLLNEIINITSQYKDRADVKKIPATSLWK